MQLPKIDLLQLLEKAVAKVGGTRVLSRRLLWPVGGLSDTRAGRRPMSPYRASQLSEITGEDRSLCVFSALRDQARTEDERAHWDAVLSNTTRVSTVDLREIVEDEVGPRYVFVLASALERAGIRNETEARAAARRGAKFFDKWPGVFESGLSRVAIGERRQLMCEFLCGDKSADATAARWIELVGIHEAESPPP